MITNKQMVSRGSDVYIFFTASRQHDTISPILCVYPPLKRRELPG